MRCGAVRFVRFSDYKTANRIAPCGVVRCGARLLAVRCSYAILRTVLVRFWRFVRFMRFGEHPYLSHNQKPSYLPKMPKMYLL